MKDAIIKREDGKFLFNGCIYRDRKEAEKDQEVQRKISNLYKKNPGLMFGRGSLEMARAIVRDDAEICY